MNYLQTWNCFVKRKMFSVSYMFTRFLYCIGILKLGFNIHDELMATHTETKGKKKKKTEKGFWNNPPTFPTDSARPHLSRQRCNDKSGERSRCREDRQREDVQNQLKNRPVWFNPSAPTHPRCDVQRVSGNMAQQNKTHPPTRQGNVCAEEPFRNREEA